jgi:large subunit ribosomal protein L18
MTLRTIMRRRRECKTDYKARMGLIKSKLPRIVIRKTNRYIIMQLIESSEALDKVIITTNTQELVKYGLDEKFAGSSKSVPAAYLGGLLMAKKIKKGAYIIDLGMAVTKFGGRLSAAIKGLIDGGLDINANEKIFPSEERLSGKHLKKEIQDKIIKVKENILKNGK